MRPRTLLEVTAEALHRELKVLLNSGLLQKASLDLQKGKARCAACWQVFMGDAAPIYQQRQDLPCITLISSSGWSAGTIVAGI